MNIPQSQPTQSDKQYLHTMIAGALLPLAQATIIALAVGLGVLVIAWLVFDAMDPHKPAIFFFVVTWVFMLIKLQKHWLSLTTLEHVMQMDFNHDGVIGDAQEKVKPRRVVIQMDRVKENGHYQTGDTSSRVEFPCDDDQLFVLATGLVNGMPFTDRTWAGDDKSFTEQEWRDMKAAMFRKYGVGDDAEALIEYVNPENKKHGIRLTATGKKVMDEIAQKSVGDEA